jgi:hypothetical protein
VDLEKRATMDTALLSNLPAELRSGTSFGIWYRSDKSKIPCQALTGKKASTSQPRHWCFLKYAISAIDNRRYRKQWAGVGRLCNYDEDSILALDVDNCILPDRFLNAYARKLVDSAATYAEVTPSGQGIRIFFKGTLPLDWGIRHSKKLRPKGSMVEYPNMELQLFVRGQYVTITGNRIPGTGANIARNEEFLGQLLQAHSASGPVRKPRGLRPVCEAGLLSPLPATPEFQPDFDAGVVSPKRTNGRIAHMRRTNAIFEHNWWKNDYTHQRDRAQKGLEEKTTSEYQQDLVDHAYVRYQMSRADLEYMCRLWCRLHNVHFQVHRMHHWIEHAKQAFNISGRQRYKEYETARKRAYRAQKHNQTKHPPKNTQHVRIRDAVSNPPGKKGDRTRKILELRADGKSQWEIARELGISRSSVYTPLRRTRAQKLLQAAGDHAVTQWSETAAPALDRVEIEASTTLEGHEECEVTRSETNLRRLYKLAEYCDWDRQNDEAVPNFEDWKRRPMAMCAEEFERYCEYVEFCEYEWLQEAELERLKEEMRYRGFRPTKRKERYDLASIAVAVRGALRSVQRRARKRRAKFFPGCMQSLRQSTQTNPVPNSCALYAVSA